MAPENNNNAATLEPQLYGIAQSNRALAELWGKNCFNSAFPVSLACFMRSSKIKPVYVRTASQNSKLSVSNSSISASKLFNVSANVKNEDLYFSFESKFEPYLRFVISEDELASADVVIKHNESWRRVLQIKLTVVPDQSTGNESQELWAPELVLRPADTCSCALGIYASIEKHSSHISQLFKKACGRIQHWSNHVEIERAQKGIFDCVESLITTYRGHQQPYLLQPIWMTEGKSPALAQKALDVFVWSDYALIATYLLQARNDSSKITRATRAVLRFARMIYELANAVDRRISIKKIIDEMSYNWQTDKEITLNGKVTRQYLTSPYRYAPRLDRNSLNSIILHGGHRLLRPERRFDQTVFYYAGEYFPDED